MLTGPQIGYLGGIIGSIVGIAGGIIGTYCSIKNTRSPLERRFMIKASFMTWIALMIFLGLLFALPAPYRFLVWIPYGILLPIGIRYTNKRQREIQAGEQKHLP
jgi:Ca2+/Na+ antiporter